MMATKMMVTIVLKKVPHQKRRLLLLNVDARRRMIVTVMKTGKEPKKELKKLGVYVF
jgi:ADP-glucose pyrophosphorylase